MSQVVTSCCMRAGLELHAHAPPQERSLIKSDVLCTGCTCTIDSCRMWLPAGTDEQASSADPPKIAWDKVLVCMSRDVGSKCDNPTRRDMF